MDYEQDDAELSALEYARMTGLSIAYDSVQPHIDIQTLLLDKAGNQEPWILLNTVTVNDIDKLTKERLAISKDAALLLRAMHELQLAPSISQEVRIRDMKQELPLLSTDEELDMLEFGHRVVPDFRNLMIPTEMINVDDDEGFEWPMKYHAYPSECDRQISAVKLAISRDGLLVLQEAVSDPYVPEDCTAIEVDDLKYQPVCGSYPAKGDH